MCLVEFKDQQELDQFVTDFKDALNFTKKINEVDTEGVEPLENVLDFYGGNEEKMRSGLESDDLESQESQRDARANQNILKKNAPDIRGNLVAVPKAFKKNEEWEE